MEFLPVSVPAALAAIAIIVAGSTMQSATGLGVGLLAAPLLFLIDPVFVPGPSILSSLSLTIPMAIRGRQHIDRDLLWPVILGLPPGAILAGALMADMDGPVYRVAFGAVLLIAVIMSAAGWRPVRTPAVYFVTSALSAIVGTVAAVGGAVLALLYQDQAGPAVRATLALLYTIAISIMVVVLAVIGRFGADEAIVTLLLIPAWLLGYRVSRPLAAYLDAGRTRTVILLISGGSALFLIVRDGAGLLP
ncbi:MAG: sulfite exporter TauE/SafE family protein [Rhodospirillales bacterium]